MITAFRLALAAVVAVLLLATHWKAYHTGSQVVEHRWSIERARTAEAHADAIALARATEDSLRLQYDAQLRKARHEETRNRAERDALLAGLRNRPAARADVPTAPAASTDASVGCTGAQLARPDAEFLVRYAADAAQLHAALSQCTALYDAARAALQPN